jgi:hypothetical protein
MVEKPRMFLETPVTHHESQQGNVAPLVELDGM